MKGLFLAKYNHTVYFRFFILLSILLLPFSKLYAKDSCWSDFWHPFIAAAGGSINSSKLTEPQYFPIQNPITDSYFYYTGNKSSQSGGFIDGFMGFEWKLGQRGLILQLGLDYQQASLDAKGSLIQGADVISEDTFSYEYNIILRQLLFAGKFLLTIKEKYHPYIFGGIGAAFNTASDFKTDIPIFLTFTRDYASNTISVFSYSVGIGFDFDLDQALRIGFGYRFSDFGKAGLGNAKIDGTPVSGTLSKSKIYTNEVFGQVTWKFY